LLGFDALRIRHAALRRDGINPLNSKEIVRALRRLSKPFC